MVEMGPDFVDGWAPAEPASGLAQVHEIRPPGASSHDLLRTIRD